MTSRRIANIISLLIFIFCSRIHFIGFIPAVLIGVLAREMILRVNNKGENHKVIIDDKKAEPIGENLYEIENTSVLKIDLSEDAAELKDIMDKAYYDLKSLKLGQINAKHESISSKCKELYETGVRIFNHLRDNPRKIRPAHRFFDYYLDTAARLINKYINFCNMKVSDERIENVFEQTDRALGILNEAFQKQYIKLMENDLMEVEASTKVLEDILKMEEW